MFTTSDDNWIESYGFIGYENFMIAHCWSVDRSFISLIILKTIYSYQNFSFQWLIAEYQLDFTAILYLGKIAESHEHFFCSIHHTYLINKSFCSDR